MSETRPLPHAIDFGSHFAVLNLDLMAILIDNVQKDIRGEKFVSSCARWCEAVHEKSPRPVTIFTSLTFSQPSCPELTKGSPFSKLLEGFGPENFAKGRPEVEIHPRFKADENDIVLAKTRWSGTSGNSLGQLLKAQGIDTVIISGITLSGVVMATIYRLFDLDIQVYVIRDNVVELPLEDNEAFSRVMLDMLLPKMNLQVISLEEALGALGRC
ncbi:unnamed protein product [Clonostachys rosea f. rosea IK726]|uniref:Isochorismatase-like domain-containing protein n=2 Tax=Bionectria ochroleuca TaxID=29856 RepID=A0A0B7JQB2_BIOOC|nr:unnamed protein product [Clonostachys rosea f. rosea IK726]